MSKEYRSIKVEVTVYKRAIYVQEMMKGRIKAAGLKSTITMSTVLNDSLRELERWFDELDGETK